MTRRSKRAFRGRLRSFGYKTYSEYLASDHWKATRTRFWKKNKNRTCRGCGGAATQVHHVTYKRLGAEKPYDLVAVCRSCHEAVHEAEAPNGRLRRTTFTTLAQTARLKARSEPRDA